MQHMDEPLRRFTPRLIDINVLDVTHKKAIMDEHENGEYVKLEDVRDFLAIIAKKVRMI